MTFKSEESNNNVNELINEYEMVLNNTHDLIFFVSVEKDITFRYIRTNKQYKILTGLSSKEIKGKTPHELFEKNTADFITARYKKCCQLKEKIEIEETLDLPTGTGVYHTVVSPVFKNGEVVKLIGIGRDITEQKQVKKRLKQNENKFRAYIEKAPVGIFVIDKKGNYLEVNNEACKIAGYSQGELLNLSIKDIIAPENYTEEVKHFEKLIETGHAEDTFLITQKNGNRVWIYLLAIHVGDNYYIGFASDITQLKETESKLRESQKLFDYVLKATNDGIWDWNVKTGEAYFSNSFYTMLGYEPGEFEASYENWRKLVHPDELVKVEKDIKANLEGNSEGFDIEFRAKTKENSYKWILSRGKVVEVDENKNPCRVVGSHIDINERKKYEEMCKSIINAAKTVSLITTDLNGIIEEFSPGAEIIFAYNREEMIGEQVSRLYEPLDIEKIPKCINKLKQDREGFTIEKKLVRKSGEVFPARLTLQPLFDNEGNIFGTLGITVDISDLKETEKKLRESEKRLNTLITQVPAIIYSHKLIDDKPVLTYITQKIEDILGFKPEDFINNFEFWKNCVHPDDIHNIQIGKNPGDEIANEYRFKNVNGEYHWILDQHKVIENESGEKEIIGAWWDISEHKQAEEQQKMIDKLESVGLLAGGIAHDFNNLLAITMGYISLAKTKLNSKSENEKKVLNILEDIEKSFNQAKQLTRQLLTFSKGGSPVLKPASLNELLYESVSFALKGSNIVCNFDLENELYPVKIDEGQISQVINNLVINAVQSMPGGGTITVRARNIEPCEQNQYLPEHMVSSGEKYVKVSISDQGCGIPGEIIDKIFDPYFSTKEKNRGLGLATSLSIVKKHEGYITVESEEKVGTTFHLYFKASPGEEVEQLDKPVDNDSHVGKKVLIMDDQEKLREVLSELFISIGLKVTTAADGDEAIKLYKQADEPFDLVFLDLTVPGGKGGKETIKELKKIDPNVKAIVISGYSDDEVLGNYDKFGFNAAITKPFNVSELKNILNYVINN